MADYDVKEKNPVSVEIKPPITPIFRYTIKPEEIGDVIVTPREYRSILTRERHDIPEGLDKYDSNKYIALTDLWIKNSGGYDKLLVEKGAIFSTSELPIKTIEGLAERKLLYKPVETSKSSRKHERSGGIMQKILTSVLEDSWFSNEIKNNIRVDLGIKKR